MFLSSLNRAEDTGLRVLETGKRMSGYVSSEFSDIFELTLKHSQGHIAWPEHSVCCFWLTFFPSPGAFSVIL